MRAIAILFILLGFPALEIYTLIWAWQFVGWWLVPWLVFTTVVGWTLIQEERLAVFGRILGALHSGQSPFSALLESSRMLIAGLLLMFPGLLSDALAVLLLLVRRRGVGTGGGMPPEPGVIEGEWHEVDGAPPPPSALQGKHRQ